MILDDGALSFFVSATELSNLVGDANDTYSHMELARAIRCSTIRIQMHTAGRTGASVASLEGLLVATLAEIVGAGVDDDGALESGR